jgi:hypothetical protein
MSVGVSIGESLGIYIVYDESVSGEHQLQAKLQCREMPTRVRDHFGVVAGVGGRFWW